MYGQFPMTSDIPIVRRAAVRAYPMPILRGATSSRADGPVGLDVDRLVAILRVRVSPAYSMSLSEQQLVAELGEPGWSLLTSRRRPVID